MDATPARDLLLCDCARTLIRVRAIQLSRRPGFRRADYDDLRQEMLLDLLRRADQFDPERGSAATFVRHVVSSSVSNILRTRRSVRRAKGLAALSIERTTRKVNGKSIPIGDTVSEEDLGRRIGVRHPSVIEQFERSEAITRVYSTLNTWERDVWRCLTCRSATAVAREMVTSRRKVRNTMATIRYQLEVAGLKNS
jgi:RNA polymerase sigma factor (sigma-70 family)